MKTRDSQASDVIIIGGGATGAGIARDCALRGLRVILVERHDMKRQAFALKPSIRSRLASSNLPLTLRSSVR